MNSGCSASSARCRQSAGCSASSSSQRDVAAGVPSARPRPGARPRRRCCDDGHVAAASSAVAFIGTTLAPRRRMPSAVISAFASASCSRAATAVGAVAGEDRQVDRARAWRTPAIAATVSGAIGMKTPTASPSPTPSRPQAVRPAGRPSRCSSRVGHRRDLAVLALPEHRDASGVRLGPPVDAVVGEVERAPGEPLRPGDAVGDVEDLVVGSRTRWPGPSRRRPRTTRCRPGDR